MKPKIILTTLFFLIYTSLWACNSASHHSVLSHFNHASAVFVGKVIKVGNAKKYFSFCDKNRHQKSYFIQFEIIKNYKNKSPQTKQITVGKSLDSYATFELGQSYLIYANPDRQFDFLLCEKGVNFNDSLAMLSHSFLNKIPFNYTGKIIEKSKNGKIRAIGKLQNGLAVGQWFYYALSGELQIKGSYKEGEEQGEWLYYHHTQDDSYRILERITTGAYFRMTNDYQFISLDTNEGGIYKKKITYLLDSQLVEEFFYYNKLLLQKKIDFSNGWRNGSEFVFDEKGDTLSYYTFVDGLLAGTYYTKQFLPSQKGILLKVRGFYINNKKREERHYYYEKGKLFESKIIIKKGKIL